MLTELVLGLLMMFLPFQLPQTKLLIVSPLLHFCPSVDLGSSSFFPDESAQNAI